MNSITQPVQLTFYDGKVCPRCSSWKPFTEYYTNKKRHGGFGYECKSCQSKNAAQRRTAHIEKARERELLYRTMNKERIKQQRIENKGRYHQSSVRWQRRNREYIRATQREWYRNHVEETLIKTLRYRSRKKSAPGSYTIGEWRALKARYDFRCLRCFRREPEIKLTMDHIVPLTKGGTNYIHNIQPLCKPCNSSKNNTHICYRPDKLLR